MERVGVLSVIVVTHDSEQLLEALADALDEALAVVDHHEIVIVDSGSADATIATARKCFPSAQVVDLGWNAGYAAGINRGIGACSLTGPVLILNPDTRPDRESVAALVHATGDEGVGITAPRLVNLKGETAKSLRRRPTLGRAWGEAILGGSRAGRWAALGEVVQASRDYERPGRFDWATGAVLCITRGCLEAVGPWDESFFLYSEETDFALRAHAAGYALAYVPRAEVFHAAGDAMTAPRLFALLSVNRLFFYRRRHGRAATAGFWLALVANSGARALRGSVPHRCALSALFRPRGAVVAAARNLRDGAGGR